MGRRRVTARLCHWGCPAIDLAEPADILCSMTAQGDGRPLDAGTAFADLSHWRKVRVSGSDAATWLNDLISADIADLSPGRSRRSLLLSPTGRIRAEFTVAGLEDALLLIQDPRQPGHVGDLLSPYTLSSDVALDDRSGHLALFAFPGGAEAPDVSRTARSAPSCLGEGVDLLAAMAEHDRLLSTLRQERTLATSQDVEAWRVTHGVPRLGPDVLEGDLPQEGGLTDAVAFDKGCYLGQEAVAKVRNLGHPRRLVIHLEGSGPVSPGDPVEVSGRDAGSITSVARSGDGVVALARIRWDAREGPFRTRAGMELRRARPRQPTPRSSTAAREAWASSPSPLRRSS
jgi:folate-binding protein YgfZ